MSNLLINSDLKKARREFLQVGADRRSFYRFGENRKIEESPVLAVIFALSRNFIFGLLAAINQMVEAAGIEPASESASLQMSTCIVRPLGFAAIGSRRTRYPRSLGRIDTLLQTFYRGLHLRPASVALAP